MPYVSHDIGTFHAVSPNGTCDKQHSPILTPRENRLPPEMYARWVQLGAFQPLERLHSHHGKRLPWEYEGKPGHGRGRLPAAARVARPVPVLARAPGPRHRDADGAGALPAVARRRRGVRAPVAVHARPRRARGAGQRARATPRRSKVWFPPGTWVDWFTGERHQGPAIKTLSVPLERMPVFARAGGDRATPAAGRDHGRRAAARARPHRARRPRRGDGRTTTRATGLAYDARPVQPHDDHPAPLARPLDA